VIPFLAACTSQAGECRVVEGAPAASRPDGPEAGRKPASLVPVLTGCGPITEVQFLPGSDTKAAVLAKDGTLWAVDLAAKTVRAALALPVTTRSEMGLLGIAFHPDFATNRRLWLSYNPPEVLRSHVEEYRWEGEFPAGRPVPVKVVLTVDQPYANHDGGQIQFGPDAMLYVALGDGGSAGDPKNAGQRLDTHLGKILRLHPDGADPKNPLADRALPEIWAYGLRNPWKFTFAPDGRMIAADVGQNTWEEVTFVLPGGNHGWKVREGAACFEPATGCATEGMVEPIWMYGRDAGVSVTGGVVGAHAELGALAGRYLFADYGTGRMWALPLPETGKTAEPWWLGRFPGGITTFGRDASGRVYVGNLNTGEVARLVSP
jgi:glucose/arabinose dehydrogenase